MPCESFNLHKCYHNLLLHLLLCQHQFFKIDSCCHNCSVAVQYSNIPSLASPFSYSGLLGGFFFFTVPNKAAGDALCRGVGHAPAQTMGSKGLGPSRCPFSVLSGAATSNWQWPCPPSSRQSCVSFPASLLLPTWDESNFLSFAGWTAVKQHRAFSFYFVRLWQGMWLRGFHLSLAVGGFFLPTQLVLIFLSFSIGFFVLCQKNPRAGLLGVYLAPLCPPHGDLSCSGHKFGLWCLLPKRLCAWMCNCTPVCARACATARVNSSSHRTVLSFMSRAFWASSEKPSLSWYDTDKIFYYRHKFIKFSFSPLGLYLEFVYGMR